MNAINIEEIPDFNWWVSELFDFCHEYNILDYNGLLAIIKRNIGRLDLEHRDVVCPNFSDEELVLIKQILICQSIIYSIEIKQIMFDIYEASHLDASDFDEFKNVFGDANKLTAFAHYYLGVNLDKVTPSTLTKVDGVSVSSMLKNIISSGLKKDCDNSVNGVLEKTINNLKLQSVRLESAYYGIRVMDGRLRFRPSYKNIFGEMLYPMFKEDSMYDPDEMQTLFAVLNVTDDDREAAALQKCLQMENFSDDIGDEEIEMLANCGNAMRRYRRHINTNGLL